MNTERSSTNEDFQESSTLYRMVGPGRFVAVSKQEIARLGRFRLARFLGARAVVAVSVAVFLLAGLYPPWVQMLNAGDIHSRIDAGYHSIFSPPKPRYKLQQVTAMQIDTSRLVVEWVCILAAAAAGLLICGPLNRREKNSGSAD